jgi:hypothetical protein
MRLATLTASPQMSNCPHHNIRKKAVQARVDQCGQRQTYHTADEAGESTNNWPTIYSDAKVQSGSMLPIVRLQLCGGQLHQIASQFNVPYCSTR